MSPILNEETLLNFYHKFVQTENEVRSALEICCLKKVDKELSDKIEDFLSDDFKYIKYPFVGTGKSIKTRAEYLKKPIQEKVVSPECSVDERGCVIERKLYLRANCQTWLKERVFIFKIENDLLKICELKKREDQIVAG